MPESLVSLRLPAVVWLASTAILVADYGTRGATLLGLLAWLVFVGGVAFFFVRIWRDAG